MLLKSELKFTKPSSFNDPYDTYPCLIYLKFIPESLRETYVQTNYIELTIQQQKELLNNKNDGNIVDSELYPIFINYQNILNERGITCFSQIEDNLLMWSHYSNSHKGVCVGFDLNILCSYLNNVCPKKLTLERIKYTEKFESIDYFRNPNKALINLMITKSIDWEYEKEIRILFSHVDFKGDILAFYPFCKEAVNKVLLGSKMKDDEKLMIIEICKEKYPKAKIFEMELDKNSFNLISRPAI